MRIHASALLWILVGALTVGLGMWVILQQAKDDRRRLTYIVSRTQADLVTAQQVNQTLLQAANKKLELANADIAKAQTIIQGLKEEHRSSAQAQSLAAPKPQLLKGWSEAVNLSLGVTCRVPLWARVETNDATALTLVVERSTKLAARPAADARWFSITPYDERLEKELINSLATSTSVAYLVHGHSLLGRRGRLLGSAQTIFVLRARQDGANKYLIWARTHEGVSDQMLLAVFSTLNFKPV